MIAWSLMRHLRRARQTDPTRRLPLSSLLPLGDPEYLDPRLRLRGPTGERCGTGILPRHGGGSRPARVDQVAGERLVVGIISIASSIAGFKG